MAAVESVYARLGFVGPKSGRPGELDLWLVQETGDWNRDNAQGRGFADQCVEHMRENDAPMVLGYVVEAMLHKGRYGGVEVGFFHRIAQIAISK